MESSCLTGWRLNPMTKLTLVLESRKPSKGLGHKRRVMQDEEGTLYLECNNPNCEQPMKPFEMFYDKKGKFQGKREECNACNIKGVKNWTSENREQVNENNRLWRMNNPERARENSRNNYRRHFE